MDKLIKGLHQFQEQYFSANRELFEQMAKGQDPDVLFITCSDSRVDPNLITQSKLGQLFVIRNAGNLVPPYGSANGGEGAAIEYAIQALNVKHIIVCGHSGCGAIKGLLNRQKLIDQMPLVYEWLAHAESTRRVLVENYSNCKGEQLIDIATAENVLCQIENLRTYPLVRSRLHSHSLALHAWVFEIDEGEIYAYDAKTHKFIPADEPQPLLDLPEYQMPEPCPAPTLAQPHQEAHLPGAGRLSATQADRIFRGTSPSR